VIRLLRVRGIPIRLDAGWLAVFALVTWSLAAGYFPVMLPAGSRTAWWLSGILAALLLFVSVLVHEVAHAIVARAFGVGVAGVTLHVFGGVAELEAEPPSPLAEAAIAIVGPVVSAVLGAALLLARQAEVMDEWTASMVGYLGLMNVAIACFNLAPGFPLDGGRLLRALLWWWSDRFLWATRVACTIGAGFGLAVVALGIFRLVRGETMGGAWFVVLGAFLFQAARTSGELARLWERLSPLRVADVMTRAPVAVSVATGVDDVRSGELAALAVNSLPVIDGGTLVGFLRRADADRHRGRALSITDVMVPLGPEHVVAPRDDVWLALLRLSRNEIGVVAVVDEQHVIGVVGRADVERALADDAERRILDRAA
jgi:Zn-dependent protease